MQEGDKNTKFFHRIANSHRRYNSISSLMINGEMSTDKEAISVRKYVVAIGWVCGSGEGGGSLTTLKALLVSFWQEN